MNRDYPYEAYEKIAKQGWLGLLIPEEEGGSGGDIFDYSLMAEGLGKFGFDFACSVLVPTFTAMNITKFGTPEQKKKYVQAFIDGRIRFSVSISEPDAGSDAANTKTRARRDANGDWIVNGQKLGAVARPRRTP
ncbi:acyl-CoA dehydrogenase family protein [Burkholderia cepacia]|uniref:acyl-CoA dehydrogenase family protein n=1 Tax=Burkholderia cepacia TaxID=292 RepID=UPI0021F4C45B|nr:acyl-CoA dehydrogenase family protein [Burkholderia cepacia]